jgi:hypothetical protein
MQNSPYQIRNLRKDDHNFVYATWLQSFWDNSPLTPHLDRPTYFSNHSKLVGNILSLQNKSYVCYDPEDDCVIWGYLIGESFGDGTISLLHFIYTKGPFRGNGIAKALFKHSEFDPRTMQITHRTSQSMDYEDQHDLRLLYNPYIIRR